MKSATVSRNSSLCSLPGKSGAIRGNHAPWNHLFFASSTTEEKYYSSFSHQADSFTHPALATRERLSQLLKSDEFNRVGDIQSCSLVKQRRFDKRKQQEKYQVVEWRVQREIEETQILHRSWLPHINHRPEWESIVQSSELDRNSQKVSRLSCKKIFESLKKLIFPSSSELYIQREKSAVQNSHDTTAIFYQKSFFSVQYQWRRRAELSVVSFCSKVGRIKSQWSVKWVGVFALQELIAGKFSIGSSRSAEKKEAYWYQNRAGRYQEQSA